MTDFLTALELTLPVLIAGILHMVVVRFRFLPRLNFPIHEKSFGANKTWRGLLLMPVLSWFALLLCRELPAFQNAHLLPLGLALGLGYAVFELPNSFLKRKLGIAPGKLPPRNRLVFLFLDQADSAIGCVLAYALFLKVQVAPLVICILLGPLVHLFANFGLYLAGLRKEPV